MSIETHITKTKSIFNDKIKLMINIFSKLNLNKTKWILFFLLLFLSTFVRFFPNNYPDKNSLVFDEAYFVPQTESYFTGQYFFDIHPDLGRMFMYYGTKIFNPNITFTAKPECETITDEQKKIDCNAGFIDASKVGNKPDKYQSYLNLQGIRFFPRVFGSLLPPLLFLTTWEFINFTFVLLRKRNNVQVDDRLRSENYNIPFLIGLMAALENSWIVESRFALQTPFLLFFMCLTIYFTIKYFNASFDLKEKIGNLSLKERWNGLWNKRNLLIIAIGLSLGCAASVKWLGLGVAPFIALVIFFIAYREFIFDRDKIIHKINELSISRGTELSPDAYKMIYSRITMLANVMSKLIFRVMTITILAGAVYIGIYSWHFGMFNKVSLEENNNKEYAQYCQQCYDDLANGTHNSNIFQKVYAQTEIADLYNKNVVALDYSKPDEIGSEWIKWPLMSRVIQNYFSIWNGDLKSEYRFLSLIGNPVNWYLGLFGIIVLTSSVIVKFLSPTALWKNTGGRTYFYILIVVLYFSNWLPFAFVQRVMYLYHYMPALLISFLAFAVVLEDMIIPRIHQFSSLLFSNKSYDEVQDLVSTPNRLNIFSGILYCLIIGLVIASYFFYYPFTYLLPLHKEDFAARNLVKDWNLKWPGN